MFAIPYFKSRIYNPIRVGIPMKKRFLPFFLLIFSVLAHAQEHLVLSDSARVSLMTVAPGPFIYSTFGHSAIRIFDPVQRFDRCYNYGTFDFEQPNFVLKFCRGKLLYMLDLEPYRSFEYGNLQDHRQMEEQLLNMTKEEKQRLFNLLQENYKPENRFYKYDFFYDNCATRIRDIFEETYFQQLNFDSTGLSKSVTMRDLLHQYLGDKPWLGLGIDLILGLPADRKATAETCMFLPDYLHDLIGKARKVDGQALVSGERLIPRGGLKKVTYDATPLDHPIWITSLFALIGLLTMANPRNERIFDTFFWFILGVAGLIIAFLWFATDHSATKNNMNILWALPTHLLFFYRSRLTEATQFYFTLTGFIALALLVCWKWLPQDLPNAAIPLVMLVVVKSLGRRFWKKEVKYDDEI